MPPTPCATLPALPEPWRHEPSIDHAARAALTSLLDRGALRATLPGCQDIFRAFELTTPDATNVVILGQDPYPSELDAMGLAFSSPARKLPASLRNIYKEMTEDLGAAPATGDLTRWATQGVLLANAALTLGQNGQAHHAIWVEFTRAWIRFLARSRPRVWLLWGNKAQAWQPEILGGGHHILSAPHPSPLSARKGFFGSRPFSRVNAALTALGHPKVDW